MKKVELKWSGYHTSLPTFEKQLSLFEINQLESLLCGVKIVSESKQVHLHESLLEEKLREQQQEVHVKSHQETELTEYLILNNFADFLQFTIDFFNSCS